ncbi:hypothetical protein J4453_00815 [Candidatus Woesearchaeota archaeon]|nr:hypothetical protein [Candidatus Woesearchaeota archaeon]
MKKGMLFTVLMTFLGLVLLASAVLLSSNAGHSEEIAARIFLLDRVYEISNSIERMLQELVVYSGVSIAITNTTVSFEETLPNATTPFNASMAGFKAFIESTYPSTRVNLTLLTTAFPLIITPYEINYAHNQLGGREIVILPTAVNFNRYSVKATFIENITGCPNAGTHSPPLYVEAFSPAQNCPLREVGEDTYLYTEYGSLHFVMEGGKLTMRVNGTAAHLITNITFTADPTTRIEVYYPAVASINFTDFGISKEGRVRIQ